jgi:bifunctional DNA-binding transcriptional regulator/antitoxin component of YhaV-PrlF toxin-antitoxin module
MTDDEINEYVELRKKYKVGDKVRLVINIGSDRTIYEIVKIKTIRRFGIIEGKKVKLIKQWIEEGWSDDVDCHIKHIISNVTYSTSLCNLAPIGSRKAEVYKNKKY